MTDTTLLVDGNNIIVRVIKALEYGRASTAMSRGSTNTGPLHVFGKVILSRMTEVRPTRVVVCFDGDRNKRRIDLDPQYKANRPPKVPEEQSSHRDKFALIKEWLTLMGVFHIQYQDSEADDLIGYYWKQARERNDNVVILSSDRDMLTLVDNKTTMIDWGSGGKEDVTWGPDEVHAKYGCWPSELLIMKALMGDSSDNIKGIPGIGPVKAGKIGAESGWVLADILTHPKVVDHAHRVTLNMELMDISGGYMPPGFISTPPLFVPVTASDPDGWATMIEFLSILGMKELLNQVSDWGNQQALFSS